MNIHYDNSYITPAMQEFVTRGYAVEDFHSLRFEFTYTQAQLAQRQADLKGGHRITHEDIEAAAFQKNAVMKPIMDAIASEFRCYQYDDSASIPYDSTEWDLYFWCNCLSTKTGQRLVGRDFSYFTLSFNEKHTVAQRRELCSRVLESIAAQFSENENLSVTIQHTTTGDKEKIDYDAKILLPSLLDSPCIYKGITGKIVQTSNGVFFKKKYAKTMGWKLSPSDILKISWRTTEAA